MNNWTKLAFWGIWYPFILKCAPYCKVNCIQTNLTIDDHTGVSLFSLFGRTVGRESWETPLITKYCLHSTFRGMKNHYPCALCPSFSHISKPCPTGLQHQRVGKCNSQVLQPCWSEKHYRNLLCSSKMSLFNFFPSMFSCVLSRWHLCWWILPLEVRVILQLFIL